MATRSLATATLTWNPGHPARRRSPLYKNFVKAIRMALLVLALTCLGQTLLSALRTQAGSVGAGLTVAAARAEESPR